MSRYSACSCALICAAYCTTLALTPYFYVQANHANQNIKTLENITAIAEDVFVLPPYQVRCQKSTRSKTYNTWGDFNTTMNFINSTAPWSCQCLAKTELYNLVKSWSASECNKTALWQGNITSVRAWFYATKTTLQSPMQARDEMQRQMYGYLAGGLICAIICGIITGFACIGCIGSIIFHSRSNHVANNYHAYNSNV